MIKRIKIFNSPNIKSRKTQKILEEKLNEKGFILADDNYDLAISIGGDGTFLKMVKETGFNSSVAYMGINTGTLGFAPEIYPHEIDSFLEKLGHDDYKYEQIGILETRIISPKKQDIFYALNEIVIREADLNTLHTQILVNDKVLENFSGDGILISTSFGSTAYNLSFGGSIVYSELYTLQITPIAPLNNKVYHSLINSVIIPENNLIKLLNKTKDLLLTIDGTNIFYEDVKEVNIKIREKKINCLRMQNFDYTVKINEKFLNY